MKFTKMHGCGNDYIYVNGAVETVPDKANAARLLSDRHFGIGSDGLIFINPSESADFEMEMYNADGSLGNMCGNGIRCVAKYVYDKGLTDKTEIRIATASGIKTLKLILGSDGKAAGATVNMGEPILRPDLIPSRFEGERAVNIPITVLGEEYRVTAVSMGNPHCVTFVDSVKDLPLSETGPAFETHECFPNRTNTEFIRVIDQKTLEMRVWERGSGETLACGTGACAVLVAARLNGYTENEARVILKGGELSIKWDENENQVYLTGPAETVFEGEINV